MPGRPASSPRSVSGARDNELRLRLHPRSYGDGARQRSTKWSPTRLPSTVRPSFRSRSTSRTATARSGRCCARDHAGGRGRGRRRLDRGLRPRRPALRAASTPPERISAAVEAARGLGLPVCADRASREPHPREPGARGHNRAAAGFRAALAPTSSTRPACAASRRFVPCAKRSTAGERARRSRARHSPSSPTPAHAARQRRRQR